MLIASNCPSSTIDAPVGESGTRSIFAFLSFISFIVASNTSLILNGGIFDAHPKPIPLNCGLNSIHGYLAGRYSGS